MFCSLHFRCICLSMKIIPVVSVCAEPTPAFLCIFLCCCWDECLARCKHNLPQQVCSKDKLFILGYSSAKVEGEFELWKGVLGRHGIGNCKDNMHFRQKFFSGDHFVITSTLFWLKDRFKASRRGKATWQHPCSKHWHLLDCVLTVWHQNDAQWSSEGMLRSQHYL